MPHIVATISGHGFGHLSISAPVLNELHTRLPDLRLTIISGLTRQRIEGRVEAPFTYEHTELDFGVMMNDDLSVRVDATTRAYRHVHERWPRRIEAYADKLQNLGCDLLLSNISYLSLAAAHLIAIPAAALCPLNWADMYKYYCHRAENFGQIHAEIVAAYRSADVFLKPVPCMPMDDLNKTLLAGPVAATGKNRRRKICGALGVDPATRLVLVAMGGHAARFAARWPGDESICWLVSRSWQSKQPNVAVFEDLDIPFLDLLASCDLLMSKPGYGSFTESTCAGKPVLYLPRPDWPETSFLTEWLQEHNACRQLSPATLRQGTFADDVHALLENKNSTVAAPTGIAQSVHEILGLL